MVGCVLDGTRRFGSPGRKNEHAMYSSLCCDCPLRNAHRYRSIPRRLHVRCDHRFRAAAIGASALWEASNIGLVTFPLKYRPRVCKGLQTTFTQEDVEWNHETQISPRTHFISALLCLNLTFHCYRLSRPHPPLPHHDLQSCLYLQNCKMAPCGSPMYGFWHL